MQFPITKDRLQNYRANEAAAAEIKQRIDAEIQKICKGVELTVLNTDSNRYIYHIDNARYGSIRPHKFEFMDGLLAELRRLFPDSKIMPDPLETYIIIDWV